ncbi:MAG: pseudouridine synthase [Oscillospiraceae bacterium]|nr:pseudouridine synthase [Oscillospiraceae bacterium]
MQERVQKILAAYGIASRRKAEELIRQGRVTVNGAICVLGAVADPDGDTIAVDGVPLGDAGQRVYILLNKPRGYLTTVSDDRGRKTVMELVDCGQRVFPVGRLDMDSEGLLLLTNDGDWANSILHPAKEVEKTYLVWLSCCTESRIQQMAQPVTLDGYRIKKPELKVLSLEGDRARILVTIHEGRNRQIRRMAELSGMTVTRLRRIREGVLELGKLPVGQWRYLTNQEIQNLAEGHK